MKAWKWLVPFLLLLALAVPTTAFAAGPEDGRVVIGGTFSLESGHTLSGDLVVIGGAATLHSGSRVTGQVALIGGVLNIDGEVDQDVFALGGVVTLGSEAVVHGDLVTIGSAVNRAEGARIEGQVTEGAFAQGFNLQFPGLVLPTEPGRIQVPLIPRIWTPFGMLLSAGWSVLKALLMAALAVLVVMFWPERTARVARSAVSQPVVAFLIGLVTVIFGVTLIVALAITICLSPVSLAGALVLGVGLILGWVALGLEVGWRLAQAFKRDWHPATQAGLGTLILSLVVYAFGLIPCLGPIFGAMLWMLGLGAVLLTRFGGQDSPAPLTAPSV